jgi:hypothetical protein
MRRISLSLLSAALAGGALMAATPASAMPLSGPQLTQRIVNAEFRGYTNTMRGFENHIWHFLPDGRVRAVADSQRLAPRRENYRQEWQDIGSWRVEGDRVCVAFQGANQSVSGCYAVEAGWRRQVRLVGPYVWQGTLEAYE